MEVRRRNREQQGAGTVAVALRAVARQAVALVQRFAPGDVGRIFLREHRCRQRWTDDEKEKAEQYGNVEDRHTGSVRYC